MKAGRLFLAATLLASVSTVSMAQGRGGLPPRRSAAITEQQRETLRNLRERQMRERSELRSRQRAQVERALPPAARERMQERRQQLMRAGRMLERRQLMRQRGAALQRRAAAGRGAAGLRLRDRMIGPRGRGGMLPPDSGGVRGRVRDGR